MALPLLFFIGSSIVRAATPAIARLLVQQGYRRASSAVVKNTLKTAKKIRTIGNKKDIPIAKNKSLTIPKNKSTALTVTSKGGGKSNLGGKVIAGGAFATTAAVSADADKKKGQAQAATNKNKMVLREKQNLEAVNYSPMNKMKSKKNTNKSALDIIKKDTNIKTDAKPSKKIEKKTDKKVVKTANYAGSRSIPKGTEKKKVDKKIEKKVEKKVKKKVEKKITKKPESKLDSKGNYKGTNIKPTKLQLERLKKRGLA